MGSITEDLINKGSVNWGDVAKDSTWGAVFGPVAKKVGKLVSKAAGVYVELAFYSVNVICLVTNMQCHNFIAILLVQFSTLRYAMSKLEVS